jgi:hypothetical protein
MTGKETKRFLMLVIFTFVNYIIMERILELMDRYEIFSKNQVHQELKNEWHTNNNDIRWHANYVERFDGLEINDLYKQNDYAKLTRWDFWNCIVDVFLKYGIKSNLDIGCANNQFSFLCNSKDIFCLGVDPRESCLNISNDVFKKTFGNTKYGYIGTIKTFSDFFFDEKNSIQFDCITVLNFLHGNDHLPNEIEKFFQTLPKVTTHVLLSEPKWNQLELPKFTDNYSPLCTIDNGTIHTLYKIN